MDREEGERLVGIDLESIFDLIHVFVHFTFNLRVFDDDVIISVF